MGFDVVVVGGGVNGLFTALDLSLRGFKVLLLERGSVGSGTRPTAIRCLPLLLGVRVNNDGSVQD